MEYQHGGDIYSNQVKWDFSANVNPLGMPEDVKEAVRRSAEESGCYPDSQCRKLVKSLAAYHQVQEEMILCGNGAADLIFQIAFALKPKTGLVMAPTFSEYAQALAAAESQVMFFPLKEEEGFAVNLVSLKGWVEEKIDEGNKPEIFFLCNPNNPTGLFLPAEELNSLAEFLEEKKIRLILDECFVDFLENPEEVSLIPYLREFPHLVILKAFTKLYAMAGLRLGYMLTADQVLLEKIWKTRQPWPVSTPAQMAGLAALSQEEYRCRTKEMIRDGRRQLAAGLSQLGFFVFPSQGNYLFFRDQRKGIQEGALYRSCLKRGLLIRSCGNYPGLDGSYYRVCVKGKEENQILLSLLAEAVSEPFPSGQKEEG